MSLATRCTACGTIFRVVQDQLRVSEGWVRCGRCAEVFDAREQLFDIDREPPPYWPGDPVAADAPAEAPPPPPTPLPPPPPAPLPPPPPPVFIESDPPAPEPEPEFEREPEPEPEPEPIFTDARQEPRWVDEDEEEERVREQARHAPAPPQPVVDEPDVVLAPAIAAKTAELRSPAEPVAEPAAEPPAPSAMPEPEFMRRAQNGERWRKPGVRAALAAGLLVSLIGLGLQVMLKFHDAIVALYPGSRPTMTALCEMGGCQIRPWRRIDAVSVEASALNQAGPSNQYQLSVSLRNKSGVEVATPWIELSLNDAAGQLVARRMLSPTDFPASKPSMPAGTELPLQALIATGSQRVAGYTVEIFHP